MRITERKLRRIIREEAKGLMTEANLSRSMKTMKLDSSGPESEYVFGILNSIDIDAEPEEAGWENQSFHRKINKFMRRTSKHLNTRIGELVGVLTWSAMNPPKELSRLSKLVTKASRQSRHTIDLESGDAPYRISSKTERSRFSLITVEGIPMLDMSGYDYAAVAFNRDNLERINNL